MSFNEHPNLEGTHAFLSPSQYQWMNYDEDKMRKVFRGKMTAARGTELHVLAAQMIRLGITLEDRPITLNMYVNDGIRFRMTPEPIVKYSRNAYGSPDTISFRDDFLRIHDLKNGITPTSMKQPKGYAALFCLEYGVRPFNIGMEFRIYQNDDMDIEMGDPDEIFHIMDHIVTMDKIIEEERREML